jgi:hypothetical protein
MIQVRISPAQERQLEKELKKVADKSRSGIAETVAIIGLSVSKELASKIQPWGLAKSKGEKYKLSILIQVQKAARWANYKGTEGDIATVHELYRNPRGSVTVRPPRTFQPKSKIIDKQKKLDYAKTKQEKAGIAKAAWIEAGESIDSPLLKGRKSKKTRISVGEWIRRHASNGNGYSKMIKRRWLSSSVLITNAVSYAYSFGNNKSNVQRAINDGYKKSIKAAQKIFQSLK